MSHAARVASAMESREGQHRSADQPDMFVSALIDDAQAEVDAAREARDLAERKVKCAPHGSLKARLKTFSDTVHALLMAEGRLARMKREQKA